MTKPWIILMGILAMAGCAPPPAPDYAAQHQASVDAFMAAWDEGKLDGLDAALTPDFVRRSPGGMNAEGVAGLKKVMTDLRTAYPDTKVVLNESYHMKDVSFHLWTFTGTNTGPGSIPPTGKSVVNHGMTLLRYKDDKIAEEQVQFDVLEWQEQLGYAIVPPVASATAPATN